jgi:hypothetical protein
MAKKLATRQLWSYTGMDSDPGVPTQDLTGDTALPALIVWAMMAANSDYQVENSASYNAVIGLYDQLGITKNCIKYILNALDRDVTFDSRFTTRTRQDVQDGFTTVGIAFQFLRFAGLAPGTCPYPDDQCPGVVGPNPGGDIAPLLPGVLKTPPPRSKPRLPFKK